MARLSRDVGSMVRARFSGRQGTAPHFLVIGTRRGGSTSLYEWIVQHPAVAPSKLKKGSHYFDVNHRRGRRWFHSTFPRVPEGVVVGEASPYYMFHPLAPARIAEELPDVRLIAALRNPVDRAFSQYQFSRRRGLEDLPFEAALDQEETRLAGEFERMIADPRYESFSVRHHTYLARGRYAEQLQRLLELFPAEHVLMLQSEALLSDPHTELDRVWEFLGLPAVRLTDVPIHKKAQYGPMAEPTRRRLEDYFRPHNERLYAMPGIDFRWPSTVGVLDDAPAAVESDR